MSSDFQRRFRGKTEILNKQGINGIVGSSNNPIEKPEGIPVLNVNQYQPYQTDGSSMSNNYNNYNMNMQEINTLENNLNKQVDNINMNIQRHKMTPSETKKKTKEKRN